LPDELKDNTQPKKKRVLGDGWQNWDGQIDLELESTKRILFILVSIFGVFIIAGAVVLFSWLINPRLMEISAFLGMAIQYCILGFAALVALWLVLFSVSSLFKFRLFAPLLLVPKLINFLLSLTLRIGKLLGISEDRLVNSFFKIHNLILRFKKIRIKPQELMVLLPRCLKKDYFQSLRRLKEKYDFQMFTVGGGTQARLKIRSVMPRAIIAVACERDLLSGFIEVNPKIPVIGLSNIRPEGPCQNTEIDLRQIEMTIRHLLNCNRLQKAMFI